MTEPMKSTRMALRAFGLAEFKRRTWHAELVEGQSFDDCLRPAFWMDVAGQILGHDKTKPLGLMDRIEVDKPDTSSYRKYLIVGVGQGFVHLQEIERSDAPEAKPVRADSPLKTRWNPGKKVHEVVRTESEGHVTVMSGGFQTKDAAIDWIDNHLKAMAA